MTTFHSKSISIQGNIALNAINLLGDSMTISNGLPTYDVLSEYEDAYSFWFEAGAKIAVLRDTLSKEEFSVIWDEHLAEQPAMSDEVWEQHFMSESII